MQDVADVEELSSLLNFDEAPRRVPARRDSRLLTLFRVGKLTTDRFEELCLVRTIGAGGMLVHSNSPLLARQRVAIELRSDRKIWGSVLWIKEGTAGIGFDQRLDIETLLERQESRLVDRRSGGPRLNLRCPARLRVENHHYRVMVHDLGQHGIGISTDHVIEPDQPVAILLEGMPQLQGCAMWSREGRTGIAFNKPIPFHQLTQWLIAQFGRSWVEKPVSG